MTNYKSLTSSINIDCLVSIVVESATAEQEVLGSIPRLVKVLFDFFHYEIAVMDVCSVDGNSLAPYYMGHGPTPAEAVLSLYCSARTFQQYKTVSTLHQQMFSIHFT